MSTEIKRQERTFVHSCDKGLLPELIQRKPHWIEYVENPSAELVEISMAADISSIRYHPSPSDEQKLLALKQSGFNLKHIKDPTHEMKMLALADYGLALQHIESPTDEMKLVAFKNDPDSIYFIENPSKEMIDIALENDPNSLEGIAGATEEQQMSVIKVNGSLIKYAQKPSDAVKLVAIQSDPSSIRYFVEGAPKHLTDRERADKESPDPDWEDDFYTKEDEATYAMKLRAVELDGTVLRFYSDPSEVLIIQAIEMSPGIVFDDKYCDKITPEILEKIQPGLSKQVETIKAVADSVEDRVSMFTAARQPVAEEMDLPMDLDFSAPSEPAKRVIDYQSAFSSDKWNTSSLDSDQARSR